jgi:inorganic pyrophosphatase
MVKVFIEIESGSCVRNRYDEKTLEHKGTSQISLPCPYPYGFVIGTHAADGGCVDCYLITRDAIKAGAVVDCEPLGLLEQDEGGEIDHKVLAAIPGQDVDLGPGLYNELRNYIWAAFAHFSEAHITVGRLLPREAAIQHILETTD